MAIERSGIRFTPDRFTPASSPFQQTGTLAGSRAVVDPISFSSGTRTVPQQTTGAPARAADDFTILKDLEFTEDGLTKEYYDSANELIQMQEASARDGWDVRSPDPSNPDQYMASQYYTKLKSHAQNLGNALQQTRRYADNYAQQVAMGRIRPDERAGTRMTTLRNLGQMTAQTGLHPIVAEHNKQYANIYTREGVKQADEYKQGIINELEQGKVLASRQGNIREVQRLDESIAALENHYYDPTKDLDRAQRERASQRAAASKKGGGTQDYNVVTDLIWKTLHHKDIDWIRRAGYQVEKTGDGVRVYKGKVPIEINFGDKDTASRTLLSLYNEKKPQKEKLKEESFINDYYNLYTPKEEDDYTFVPNYDAFNSLFINEDGQSDFDLFERNFTIIKDVLKNGTWNGKEIKDIYLVREDPDDEQAESFGFTFINDKGELEEKKADIKEVDKPGLGTGDRRYMGEQSKGLLTSIFNSIEPSKMEEVNKKYEEASKPIYDYIGGSYPGLFVKAESGWKNKPVKESPKEGNTTKKNRPY